MIKSVHNWINKNISDPQAFILLSRIVSGLAVIYFFGSILAPVMVGVVLSYLLDGIVTQLVSLKLPRAISVLIVFFVYLVVVVLLLVWLYPLLSEQVIQLFSQIPQMLTSGRDTLMALPEKYPDLITASQVQEVYELFSSALTVSVKKFLGMSLSSVRNIVNVIVYLILVPFMVFFFLKDKYTIINWMSKMLPHNVDLAASVWDRLNVQITGYVRGKGWEIIIIWGVSWAAYHFIGLQYSLLLSFLAGISVILPYVGVTIVLIPTIIIPYFQFGWDIHVMYTVTAYLIIQILDGNVLVPLLLSEVVDLHPVAIVIAVLFFGGIWGVWGLFFAIPLATLIKVLIDIWLERRET